ncbi:DNA cytosine methyltransferase [Tropicibacter sp. R16_0]|uniref:DNA cytosine methyltransferase n=1 Tax=Tropicibacter sp. R16_0 TaxID=2821102 RepID=UPI002570B166|nr:DNA cytosine methyltransferase [Tropicibacter sp. R16_0]
MNCLEVFSGVGGMALGLDAAGFEHIDIVDFDAACISTLNQNITNGQLGERSSTATKMDVAEYDFLSARGRIDLLSGGPPCQPFSFGGSHRAALDKRNMFPQVVRAVREARPRAFLFENVPGLTRAKFRNYFEYLKLSLTYPSLEPVLDESWQEHFKRLEQHHLSTNASSCEYAVIAQAINAADYGVPQSRLRVFIVGVRRDQGCNWHFPLPTHSKDSLLREQDSGLYFERHGIKNNAKESEICVSDLFDEEQSTLAPWVTLRDAIQGLGDPETDEVLQDLTGHVYKPGARIYKGHTGSCLDQPAKTLKAGVNGVPGGENMMVKDSGAVRYLTIRECARVQTFPDDFVFHDVWSRAVKQLGNAVPVKLAEVLGSSLFSTLSK